MPQNSQAKKVAILGASRGLGRSLVQTLESDRATGEILAVSRNPNLQESSEKVSAFGFDLASEKLDALIAELEEFRPDIVIYCAGGGPYSKFEQAKWKSHDWALQVSFLAAARLAHWFMGRKQASTADQWIWVGSAIAEAQGDPCGSSYAAAKHALLGLYQSIQMEKPSLDLRLFSPGYMNTDLLPKGSWPRRQDKSLWEPEEVARLLWEWSNNPDQFGGHMSLAPFAEAPHGCH